MKSMNISVEHFIMAERLGYFINGTWTGALGKIAYENFDIAFEPYTPSSLRMNYFEFSTIGYPMNVYLYVKKPTKFPISWLSNFKVLKIEN